MLAYIEEGIILQVSQKFIIINKNGIGYRVHVTEEILSSLNIGDVLSLWIYTAVRENSIDLYGFSSSEEMAFFELLLEVSGIGPKSALATLGIASIETLKKAIATGDTSYLNKVSGIGKKTSERIVIELRDKLISYKNNEGDFSLRDEGDVIEALKSLGYSQSEARGALKQVPKEIEGANAKIKESLKILAKR